MTFKFTILGCGTSSGVPRIDGTWGACDPDNPRNIRRRCSLLVERIGNSGRTTILIDTSPDMRQQLLEAGIGLLDAVLYTHDHADHTHGIDDLRWVAYNARSRVDVYFDESTGASLRKRFDYCFEAPEGSDYPPILKGHLIKPGETIRIEGAGGEVAATPYLQNHGSTDSLGFRIGGLAYSCDIKSLHDASYSHLENLDVWIVDALRHTPHSSHHNLEEALAAINRVGPGRAILTHMNIELDYEALRRELPENVQPAYDGMVLELED